MTSKRSHWGFLLGLTGVVLLVDYLTKWWVVRSLAMYESIQPIPAIYPFFQITRSFNTGAAFGLFAGVPWAGQVFLVIAIVVSVVLAWSYRNLTDAEWGGRVATGLVIGGALGNAIDRVIHGHVIDFIHYQIPGLISNVSNVADHAIVGGVILMIIVTWQAEPAPPDEQDPAAPAD